MVLQVPFDQFAATVQRMLEGTTDAYIAPHFKKTVVTASKPGLAVVVASDIELTLDEARTRLENQGLSVFHGSWADNVTLEHEADVLSEVHVASVAYRTENGPPGIWVDAYTALPTQVQVLKTMYDEMTKTGELGEVSFEEFVRLSDANVVIVSPSDLRSFIAQKETP